jgi:hypothetical protein
MMCKGAILLSLCIVHAAAYNVLLFFMGEPIKTLKESWWGNLFESNHTENLE